MKNRTDTRLPLRNYELHTPHSALRTFRGFTLIELLVVISIIALLAALVLPALSRVRIRAQMKKAQMEAGGIAHAIHTYEAEFSKFPASSVGALNAMDEASKNGEDFTYGTAGVACVGPGGMNAPSAGFSTPAGTVPITAPGGYQANNSEVMAVLLDAESWPAAPGVPTINKDHVKNPQKTTYLSATRAGNTTSPGIGPDGVYRDPWGNPYIITIDLNYDDKARDAFYRLPAVSAGGLNGLILNGPGTFYEANSPVMVWSPGPDKMIDPNSPANKGANKDNILSWK